MSAKPTYAITENTHEALIEVLNAFTAKVNEVDHYTAQVAMSHIAFIQPFETLARTNAFLKWLCNHKHFGNRMIQLKRAIAAVSKHHGGDNGAWEVKDDAQHNLRINLAVRNVWGNERAAASVSSYYGISGFGNTPGSSHPGYSFSRFKMKSSTLRILSKFPTFLMRGLLHDVLENKTLGTIIRPEDLNYEMFEMCKTKPRLAAAKIYAAYPDTDHDLFNYLLPDGDLKRGLHMGRRKGLGIDPYSFKLKELLKFDEYMKEVIKATRNGRGGVHSYADTAMPMLNMIRLFGTFARCKQWLAKVYPTRSFDNPPEIGTPGDINYTAMAVLKCIHDAGQFVLDNNRYDPRWGDLIMHAPTLIRKTGMIRSVEKRLGRIPNDRKEFDDIIAEFGSSGELDAFLIHFNIDPASEIADDYRYQVELGPKDAEGIPYVCVEQGLHSVRQLPHDDIMQLMAGLATDCCQHLSGAGSTCAVMAYASPNAAIWAVYKENRIVAQAFVWRSKDDMLVIDSIETKRNSWATEVSLSIVSELFHKAAKAAVGRLGIRGVLLAQTHSGMTDEVRKRLKPMTGFLTPIALWDGVYTDASAGCYLIAAPNMISPDRVCVNVIGDLLGVEPGLLTPVSMSNAIRWECHSKGFNCGKTQSNFDDVYPYYPRKAQIEEQVTAANERLKSLERERPATRDFQNNWVADQAFDNTPTPGQVRIVGESEVRVFPPEIEQAARHITLGQLQQVMRSMNNRSHRSDPFGTDSMSVQELVDHVHGLLPEGTSLTAVAQALREAGITVPAIWAGDTAPTDPSEPSEDERIRSVAFDEIMDAHSHISTILTRTRTDRYEMTYVDDPGISWLQSNNEDK